MVKLLNETLFDYLEFMYRDKYNYYITMSNLTKLLEHALVKSVCIRNKSLAIITGPGILSTISYGRIILLQYFVNNVTLYRSTHGLYTYRILVSS